MRGSEAPDGSVPDSGSAGHADAGVLDAGLLEFLDAGLLDAGVEQVPVAPTLSVAANPNNVLSAVATVSWTTPLATVLVSVRASGGIPLVTPALPVADSVSPVTIPIVPLSASTSYSLQVVAQSSGGATLMSEVVPFTTGAIPQDVPEFEVMSGASGDGYTLTARILPIPSTSPDYLTIVDSTGTPVWYYLADRQLLGDFQQQPDGTYTMALSDPTHSVAGQTQALYRQVDVLGNTLHTWTALDDPAASPPVTVAATDNHEFRLQPNGDALLFGFIEQTMDLTGYGGSATADVVANVLERITPTGQVSFSWNPFTHLSVAQIDPAATSVSSDTVDFTHANAIDVTADGNYLISLRNLSQILKLDSKTGEILWKLGGADGQFTFVNDPLLGFSCQHAARELPNGDIVMLDDGDGHWPPQSRAVEYTLDTTAMTATLVWSAEDDPPLYAVYMGNAERLSDGHTLIAYGVALHIQEVDSGGNVVWDLFDPNQDFGFFRAFRLSTLSSLDLSAN